MANYAYIDLRKAPEDFELKLKAAVLSVLGPMWAVRKADFEDGGPVWLVEIPGTAVHDLESARRRMAAPGQDVGFPVGLQGAQISFRHGPNMYERWAQGCVEEELSDMYKRRIYFDAIGNYKKLGTRDYRCAKTFSEYLSRNFAIPLTPEDLAYIERYKEITPEGFW